MLPSRSVCLFVSSFCLPGATMSCMRSCWIQSKFHFSGSPETKIVTSLMYDFGKSLFSAFQQYVNASSAEEPLMLVKSFMTVNLDAFLELFPNLRLEHFDTIRIENRKPKAFLRRHAENSFNRCMREGQRNLNQDLLPPSWHDSPSRYDSLEIFAFKIHYIPDFAVFSPFFLISWI